MTTDMLSLADRAVLHAMSLGVSDCDVLVSQSRYTTVEIEKGSVKQASLSNDPGVGIRVFKNGSSGFAYCTGHDRRAVLRAVELATAFAKAGTPDPDFKSLPDKSAPRRLNGLFEPRLQELGPDEVVALVMELAEVAGDDKRISSVNAAVNASVGEVALVNSNGFKGTQRMTSFDIFAEAVARSGTEMFSGYDAFSSRKLDHKSVETVGLSAKEHAIMGLDKTKIETGDYPVILDPLGAGFLFAMAIGGGANADSVQRGRSYLADRLETRLGVEGFNVQDDPTLAWGNGSTSFDGEGTPARKRTLIESGILRSYLHDSYTAGKESIKSTGNSSRGGSIWSYSHPPVISISNLVVGKGDSSFDEMLNETKNGVYLRATFDYPNLATGEFSGLMMESYRVKNGELGAAIRQATMGISLPELFASMDMIGDRSRDAFGVRTPHLRISKARIAGSG